AIQLSLRKNAQLFDDRLPGGQALGKITSYEFHCDADSGEQTGSVTMACAVGYGGAIGADDGTPAYVDDGYVDAGYQFYDGQVVVVGGDDVGYTVPVASRNDDGLVLPLRKGSAFITPPVVTFSSPMANSAPLPLLDPTIGGSGGVTEEELENFVTEWVNSI